MKIFSKLSTVVALMLLLNSTTNAQVIITQLGNHPFYQPSLTSISDLLYMVDANKEDIEKGLSLVGLDDIADEFMAQLHKTEKIKIFYDDGTKFDWMFYRKNGNGQVNILENVTWVSKVPMEAYQFKIDVDGKRFTFAVPLICSNLSLRGVTNAPIDEVDITVVTGTEITGIALDIDGDGIIDGVDLDGDGVIDEAANIDLDGDGVIDGYDIDGDGKIDIKSSAALAASHGIDLDGDGVIDGVDIDGDGYIDADAGLDVDGDGVIDGYDVDGDGIIDIAAGAAVAAGATAAALAESTDTETEEKTCSGSYCGKPGWKLGLHAGYPLGSAPEDESLNLGLLLGTPLGVRFGPLSVGLGAGAFTYNFEDLYLGGGLLASLCINDLLKLDMPLKLQLHGAGFYVFGEESGPGFGGLASGTLPLGKSPLSLGVYGGAGKYLPGDEDYNWANVGAVLFYNF